MRWLKEGQFEKAFKKKEELKYECGGEEAVYPLHRGQIPFSSCKSTNGRKVIRRMFDLKVFTEMVYR